MDLTDVAHSSCQHPAASLKGFYRGAASTAWSCATSCMRSHQTTWLVTFGPQSLLIEILADDGLRLVVEDQRIPVGEAAHHFGFLVLDRSQFQKLFAFSGDQISETDYKRFEAHDGDLIRAGWLLAHRFSKRLVKNMDTSTQQAALMDLWRAADEQMHTLRHRTAQCHPSYAEGQQHAFWMAQYANATLWLKARGILHCSPEASHLVHLSTDSGSPNTLSGMLFHDEFGTFIKFIERDDFRGSHIASK